MRDQDKLPSYSTSFSRQTPAVWPGNRVAAALGALFFTGILVGTSASRGYVPHLPAPPSVMWLVPGGQGLVDHAAETLRPTNDHGLSLQLGVPSAGLPLAQSPLAPVPAARGPWQPPNAAGRPFTSRIERWRPLVRELLAEAWNEGRLDGYASSLDDDLVLAVIQQESAGDPEAVSWAGALGLMQVMPFTFAEMHHGSKALGDELEQHVIMDVRSNVRAGIRYLALALQAHEGNLYWALASYNAGIEAVDAWRAVGLYAVPPIGGYDETAHYAQVILRNYLGRRPDVKMHVPDPMPYEHVPGAVKLLVEAGRW